MNQSITTALESPKSASGSHLPYRADIDGLRAVAVLSVILFHAFPTVIKGGLVGVDIFFVISGYLISTIIFTGLESGKFSFIDFYSRRVRRIFPALSIVLTFAFILGWHSLLADEFSQLGKHIAGGAGFVSNFILLGESGYFDTDADTKPLLHLWSLGVEEQFYIAWPLILWFAHRIKINFLFVTALLAFASLALNIHTIHHEPVQAFYLPQARVWELLVGAMLAYSKLHRHRSWSFPKRSFLKNIISLIGTLLILLGIAVIDKDSQFPGWLALLPVTGATLIIGAGSSCWINRFFLANPVIIWFGLISYPLYLWHWPLLSFARIIQSGNPSISIRVTALVAAVILSWMTWRLIEKPIRFGAHKGLKTTLLITTILIIGLSGFVCFKTEGFPGRTVVNINPGKSSSWGGGIAKAYLSKECGIEDPNQKKQYAFCLQDARDAARFALLGDSKAASFYAGLFRTSTPEGRWLFIGGNGPNGAPVPVISTNKIYRQYQHLTVPAVNAIKSDRNIETVVLMTATRALFRISNSHSIESLSNSKHYNTVLEGLTNTINEFVDSGKNVVIVMDNPTLPDPKDCMDRKTNISWLNSMLLGGSTGKCEVSIERHLALSHKYQTVLEELKRHSSGNVHVFDTLEYLCSMDEGMCRSHKDGHILYSYSDHISDYAAGVIGKHLNRFLLEIGNSD